MARTILRDGITRPVQDGAVTTSELLAFPDPALNSSTILIQYIVMSSWGYKTERSELVAVSRQCPGRPYLELEIPPEVKTLTQLTIITVSHDQGAFIPMSQDPLRSRRAN